VGNAIAANLPFQSLNATAKSIAVKASTSLSSGLRELAPNTGAYMNEGAGRYEPDWQRTFWGEHYERLLKIKKAVDPDDTLWCQPVSAPLFGSFFCSMEFLSEGYIFITSFLKYLLLISCSVWVMRGGMKLTAGYVEFRNA